MSIGIETAFTFPAFRIFDILDIADADTETGVGANRFFDWGAGAAGTDETAGEILGAVDGPV